MYKYFKILFLFFPLIVVGQAPPASNPNGYNIFYHDNGKISSEGTLRDGKPDGYWKTYATSGVIKSEGNRKNFMLDSIWKFYNERGILAFEFSYKEGKKNGIKNTYDTEDGSLALSEMYVNDIKQGTTITYHKPNNTKIIPAKNSIGPVKKIIPFVNGKEEGEGFEYASDSTLITITQYKMGFVQKEEKINRRDRVNSKQGVWKEFYPNGIVKKESDYTDDLLNGYVKEYSLKGSLVSTTKYVKGVLQTDAPELAKLDSKSEYGEGGKVKFTGTYKNGVPEGVHRYFNAEGKVESAKVYAEGVLVAEGIMDKEGVQQGLWKEYYPSGKLKSIGEYAKGKRIGEWVYYFPDGKLEQKGKFDSKGRAQGVWRWYHPCLTPCSGETGKLWREENYVNNKLEGPIVDYSDSGKVITKGEYVDGEKEGPWMLEMLDYREEGNYKSGKWEGEWKQYYVSSGSLRFVGSFIDDVPTGKHVFYYPDGKVRQEGKFVAGAKDGEWKFYDEAGFIFLTIDYKNGVELRFDGVKVIPETIK